MANVYLQYNEDNGASTIVNYKYGDTEIGTHTIKLTSNNYCNFLALTLLNQSPNLCKMTQSNRIFQVAGADFVELATELDTAGMMWPYEDADKWDCFVSSFAYIYEQKDGCSDNENHYQ